MTRWRFGWACATAMVALSMASARAEAPSPHAVATNRPGVFAYTKPPADFDPTVASAQELALWGYPTRPAATDGAEALARWAQSVSPKLRRVVPDLVAIKGVYHRPAIGLHRSSAPATGTQDTATSSNWSGYALVPTNPALGYQFTRVTAGWTVPTVKQPPGTCSGGWDYSSQWVGIGGFADPDLLQAGSAANVYCDIGGNVPEYFPWLEWLPQSELVLYENAKTSTLLPFQPGDFVIVTVWATAYTGNSSTTGHLQYSDVTQGWSAALTFSAASVGGSMVTGASAEWIVERTDVGSSLATLPDYIASPWYGTDATDRSNRLYSPGALRAGAQATNVTMLDDSSAPVSSVTLVGPSALWFFPEGSAVQ